MIFTTLRANPDVFEFDIYGIKVPNANSIYQVVGNDSFYPDCGLDAPNDGLPILVVGSSNATFTILDQTELNGKFTFNPLTGVINPTNGVTTPPNTNTIPPGIYEFSYQICDIRPGYTNLCSTTYGWINVIGYVNKMSDQISVKKNLFDSFVISPNPSSGIFTITFESEITTTNIEVYSILGQKLFDKTIDKTTNFEVDLTELASGTYILKVSDGVSSVDKLIIKN